MGVQECLRDGRGGCFGRAEGAGAWTAQPGLQGLGNRREHPHEVQPLQLFLPTFVLFISSSQNSYLLEHASCQDVAIETFAPDPGCDSCSTTMLGKSQPPPPTSGRKHNPGYTENNKFWLTSSSETLQYAPLCNSPASWYQEGINIHLIPQQQASRGYFSQHSSFSHGHFQVVQLFLALCWPGNALLLTPTGLCVCVCASDPDLSLLLGLQKIWVTWHFS